MADAGAGTMTRRFDVIRTERLVMRRWRDEDRGPFAAMNADPEVMRYFPAPLGRAASDALADRIEERFRRYGFGLWALEIAGPDPASRGLPGTGLPSTGFPSTGLPSTGLPSTGLPSAGLPSTGLPSTGLPSTGLPSTGLPSTGLPSTGEFIGFTGLNPMPDGVPGSGGMEVGWRLARHAWHQGYATEAARAAVSVAFHGAGLAEIWSMTAVVNEPSQAVMRRLGMSLHARFDHPAVEAGHPLRPHVAYRIRRTYPS